MAASAALAVEQHLPRAASLVTAAAAAAATERR
jgi:hypothetical protein